MSIEQQLHSRSGSTCELCGATDQLSGYTVAPKEGNHVDENVLLCGTCLAQIDDPEQMDPNHWRCLNDSMWSEVAAVQVMAWRMLTRLRGEGWPADLLEMLYMEEDQLAWAQAGGDGEAAVRHLDSNGNVLAAGDTVVLIKTLDVKGTSFSAKRGTSVRGISLVHNNPEHIEGRVNGQKIVILTKYVKKA